MTKNLQIDLQTVRKYLTKQKEKKKETLFRCEDRLKNPGVNPERGDLEIG